MKIKNTVKNCCEPAFWICVFVLVFFALGMNMMTKKLGGYLAKEPLPLKKSLLDVDVDKLVPYKILRFYERISEDIEDSLGTSEYVTCVLEDTSVEESSALRYCKLFITYYDMPDKIPHTPEECYVGGGNTLLNDVVRQLNISAGDFEETLGVTYLVFQGSQAGQSKFPVMYCFNANGEYGSSRGDTRFILNKSFFRKYSYFSKVEWMFYNRTTFGGEMYPEQEEAFESSKKLLRVLLPLLKQEHWPDWDKVINTGQEDK